ncbi:MAG: N-acetyltransferase [Muribaculaceae bacterium]|nr:N-acetyltransferase [Muribaculaceae bacterium]
MTVEIREVAKTRRELKKSVKFRIDNYKGNDCYVPPLIFDEVNTLRPKGNPAFDFCEAQTWMAYRDNKPVGTITGIINHVANQRTGVETVRFGFVDFIDDDEVVDALFKTVEDWGRAHGCTEIVGPLGFTDMDPEGMLIEGFDRLSTQATIYNHPYYPTHMERMGFEKDADWVEFRVTTGDKVPDRYVRIAEIVAKRYDLRVVKYTSRKKLKADYGQEIFQLINKAFDNLYGYTPLTERQIQHYISMYLGILRLELVTLIVDKNDKLVAVGITIQSFSRDFQKCHGRIFPFGWVHILRGLYGKNDVVDLMLIAIDPEYQGKGVNAMLFNDLVRIYIKNGYKWAETNVELETNAKVQAQWEYFDYEQHRRRRSFRKGL